MFRPSNAWLVVAVLGGLSYPLVVYFGLSVLPPQVLVLIGLVLIGLRLAGMRRLAQFRTWGAALLVAAIGLLVLLALSPRMAVQAYPVLISLCVAGVFMISLYAPPTIVERFARVTEPDLPPEGIDYCRKVTVVWIVFLLGNAAISAAAALWGSLAEWTLWNGLLSYVAMGIVFAAEFLVRRSVKRRART